ncbi:histone deacetylase [Mycobacterium sp. SM1]|uniref:histone deacetylase family protein n=1 Tax=Mycobacterium sp. SM1 TaxID=2816243 RepID=UPI001BD1B772|nr:histone deacetylase [Mycobacterium sp. SM1]MBS4730491.1 histone deacetylase [Mycobacterium sp. SM1]
MTTIYATHPRYTEHDLPGHPENAERIRAVWRGLDHSGLSARMVALQAEALDPELALTVHTAEYLDLLRRISAGSRMTHLDADTYAGPDALAIALLSAGGAAGAVDAVLRGAAENGLAAIRPPGHHALPERGMGFCLLGNVAIATRYAQARYGVERVLIIDYDVHHGNGTEAMFYRDPSVLYVSTHQYPFYPGTGAATDIGAGPGEGYTINIPLPAGSGDTNYATVFDQVIWPAAQRYDPQLILVSMGFDAYWADPLAAMRLTLDGYSHLAAEVIRMAQRFCQGKVVFVLEGGYNLEALRYGVSDVARLLLGDPPADRIVAGPSPRLEPDIAALLARLRQLHRL